MTSKCRKKKKWQKNRQASVPLMLLLKELKKITVTSFMCLSSNRSSGQRPIERRVEFSLLHESHGRTRRNEMHVGKLSMGLERFECDKIVSMLESNWFMTSVRLSSFGCSWEVGKHSTS